MVPITDALTPWSADWLTPKCAGFPIARYLADNFITALYEDPSHDVHRALRKAVDEVVDSQFWGVLHTQASSEELELFLLDVRLPPDPVFRYLPPEIGSVPSFMTYAAGSFGISRRREQEAEHEITVGWVIKRDRYQPHQRLITWQPPAEAYPPVDMEQADLVLDLFPQEHGTAPYIPGFTVIGRSGQRWALRRDAADPYVGSELVTIDNLQWTSLISRFETMGLTDLAVLMSEHHGTPTVHDLVRFVAASSDYSYEPIDVPYEVEKLEPSDPARFAPFVADGRLQVQCGVVGTFLAHQALERVVPGAKAATMSGHSLGCSDRITGVPHLQTVLSYDGFLYLLDATPALATMDQRLSAVTSIVPAAAARQEAAKVELPTIPAPSEDLLGVPLAERLAPDTTEIKEMVLQLLSNALEARSPQDLVRKVAQLPTENPTRIAFTLVTWPGQRDLEKSVTELDSYAAADINTRRAFARKHQIRYDPELAGILAATLRPLLDIAEPPRPQPTIPTPAPPIPPASRTGWTVPQ